MAEDTKLDKKKKITKQWIPDEEKFLATVYVKISESPVVGNGLHENAFWNRVWAYFRQNTLYTVDRTKDQITSKWTDMNKKVGKFNEIYTDLKKECETGRSEEDILPLALTRYKQDVGRDFGLWHVWILLKDSPKWKGPVLTEKSSKNKRLKPSEPSKTEVCTSSQAHGSVNLVVDDDDDDDDEVDVQHPPGKKSRSDQQEGKLKATSSSTGSKVHEAHIQKEKIDLESWSKVHKAHLLKETIDLESGSKVQDDTDVSFHEFHKSMLQLTSLQLEKREDKDFQFLLMDTSNLTGIDLELVLQRKDRIRKKYVSKYGL